jgi:ABC-2 type transport system permease protein
VRREGSPWTGIGTVFQRELADNLLSVRMRLLEVLVVLSGATAVYAAIGEIKTTVSEDPFVFLRIFTVAREPLPSFITFLGFLIPLVAISLAFDSVNGEFNRRTMSRILAQPIYRDALLFGKFLAGLATLAIFLTALWLFLMGLGILLLGVPPSGEEIVRGIGFLLAAISYGGVWLALALMFSIIFRAPATSALAALSLWLLFAVFWGMIIPLATEVLAPVDPFDPRTAITAINVAQGLNRLSPNTLFAEATLALLNPGTRSLGPVFVYQLQGAVFGAPLPMVQSFLLIWPQLTGLLAAVVVLFTIGYAMFQRQEIRA